MRFLLDASRHLRCLCNGSLAHFVAMASLVACGESAGPNGSLTITGSYLLATVNGAAVPVEVFGPGGSARITGGTLRLNANGTYAFALAARIDIGAGPFWEVDRGAGTATSQGNTVRFSDSGDGEGPFTGTVNGDRLTVVDGGVTLVFVSGVVIDEITVMSRLLDDLQTLSTAEAGALRLHRSRMEPGQLVEAVGAAFRSQAEDARVSVESRVAEELPEIDVDPVRIGEVLANLLSNALRHTPPGGSVVIAAEAAPEGVMFIVTDTGDGIPADALPHVFDRFVKAKDSNGAGLGLAIAKALVESHGGRITAESEPGHGATVRVVLPRA